MSKNKTKFEVSISKSVTVQLWRDLPISAYEEKNAWPALFHTTTTILWTDLWMGGQDQEQNVGWWQYGTLHQGGRHHQEKGEQKGDGQSQKGVGWYQVNPIWHVFVYIYPCKYMPWSRGLGSGLLAQQFWLLLAINFFEEDPWVFKVPVVFICTTMGGTKVDLTLWANQLADVWGLVDKIGQQSAASVYQ